ncbi:MAG: DUF2809 domain-containing protein [Okeania sp. SIO2C9]|uniref:ribosomal maturation YjgA family protein n=1 Tax=Okeania sp. SIO2C9 TaxID=2607791 RepID=UPI0013C13E24|nr:DUF2809 domain-containing protein [Okeania sp. SIO2C9]NEQ72882.1 DUF2809 domain-containing protein [Okeania sp. SIO2C9]
MKRYRITILICLILTLILGFVTKFYQGLFSEWLNNSFSSIFYEAFWIFLVIFIRPRLQPGLVAFWVFIVTCFLEFMQLWKPPFLQAIRATLIGRLLLGNTFVWWDFLYYILGCTLTWIFLRYFKFYDKRSQFSGVSRKKG